MSENSSFGSYDMRLAYRYDRLGLVFFAHQPGDQNANHIFKLLRDVLSQEYGPVAGKQWKNEDQQLVMEFNLTPGCDKQSIFNAVKTLFADLENIADDELSNSPDGKWYVSKVIARYRKEKGLQIQQADAPAEPPKLRAQKPPPVKPTSDKSPAAQALHIWLMNDIHEGYIIPWKSVDNVCQWVDLLAKEHAAVSPSEKESKLALIREKLLPPMMSALHEGGCPKDSLQITAEHYIHLVTKKISARGKGR